MLQYHQLSSQVIHIQSIYFEVNEVLDEHCPSLVLVTFRDALFTYPEDLLFTFLLAVGDLAMQSFSCFQFRLSSFPFQIWWQQLQEHKYYYRVIQVKFVWLLSAV
jgi:hypothetical protein